MKTDKKIIDWLMKGDPAIRWQVMRDLLKEPKAKWQKEQAKVAKEGWGARLLAKQKDNNWGRGLYSPKWTSTTYTLLLLRRLGLPSGHTQALKSCQYFLDHAFQPDTGGIWNETCITGMALAVCCYFRLKDKRIERIIDYVFNEQMKDGGWNCLRVAKGATHSSFHTTINVLDGLREYACMNGPRKGLTEKAEKKARDFFLAHKLYRSHRTGKIVHPSFLMLSFPPRWHHDILRCLDYFRECQASPDRRLSDAIAVLQKKQRKDGTWPLQRFHPGAVFFHMEKTGRPSKWNTLRSLRVLEWWKDKNFNGKQN